MAFMALVQALLEADLQGQFLAAVIRGDALNLAMADSAKHARLHILSQRHRDFD